MKQDIVGLIGLGRMGGAIAGRLADAQKLQRVYDAAPEAMQRFLSAHPATASAPSAADLVAECDVVFLSLPGSPQVEGVLDGLPERSVQGKVIVDLSTSHPDSTRRLAADLRRKGCALLDGPLSGGPAQARTGELTVIAAGDEAAFQSVEPLLRVFGARVFHVGGSGNGHAVKLINNCFSGSYACMYAEILPLVQRLNLPADTVLEILGVSGSASPILRVFGPKMLHRDFATFFTTELLAKDFGYMESLMAKAGLKSGVLAAAQSLCARAREAGLAQDDVSALIKLADRGAMD